MREKKAHLRISLVNFMFGDRIWYVITVDIKNKKIKLLDLLCLEKMQGILLTDETINEMQERYKKHIKDLTEIEQELEKEALYYHIQNEEQRMNTSIDKLNIYATIILTVLPLILAISDLKKLLTLPLPLLLGVVFIIYFLLNICVYVFRAIKVRGIKKSSFADLRNSKDKNKEMLLQCQYDWQQIKYKAQLFVSFVLNLQEWVIAIIILIVFVSLGVTFTDINTISQQDSVGSNFVTTLYYDEINEPYSDSAVNWTKLIADIEQKQCKHIILMSREMDEMVITDRLEKYSELEVKIVIDPTLEKGQLKILQEE